MSREKIITLLKASVGITLLWELYGPSLNHIFVLPFVFSCAAYFMYQELQSRKYGRSVIYLFITFVYNPLTPLVLSKNTWIITNTSVAILLFANVFMWYFLTYKVATLYNKGHFFEAETVALKAFTVAKDTFGINNPNTFGSLTDLIDVYLIQSKYASAVNFIEYALAKFAHNKKGNKEQISKLTSILSEISSHMPEKTKLLPSKVSNIVTSPADEELEYLFGKELCETGEERNLVKRARTLVNSAFSYGLQHKYDEAAKLMEYAVSICEETDSSNTAYQTKLFDNEPKLVIENVSETHEPLYWPPRKAKTQTQKQDPSIAFAN